MQRLLVCAVLLASGHAAEVGHPIEKVIGLLKDMGEKAKEIFQKEEINYAKFTTWCKGGDRVLKKAIAAEEEKIMELEGIVEAKKAEIKEMTEQIKELEKQIEELEAAQKASDEAREEGAKLYEEADKDMVTTIDAVKEALKVMKDSKDDLASLLQEAPVRKALTLLQATFPAKAALLQLGGPDVKNMKAYTFKSGSVIELLKDLVAKFEQDKIDADKAETNALQAYQLEKKARAHAKAAAEDSKEEKEKAKTSAEEDLADAEASLADTKEEHETDTKSLEDMDKTCSIKNAEWEERSKTFTGEQEAIAMAIKILAKVTGVRTKPPESPLPPASPAELQVKALSFLQLADPKTRALNLIRQAAARTHSKSLGKLVDLITAKLATGTGSVFDDIIQMISKMVLRLQNEQAEEDDHKNWCDIEIEKTDSTHKKKGEKIEELKLKLEEATAKVQVLAEEIAAASKMAADLKAHMDELTDIRTEAKAENHAAIKDADEAQTALDNAINVLMDFYKSSGKVEFVQKAKRGVDLPEEPSTWDAGYTGVADPTAQPDGIVTVLKEVMADFAKMEAETKAQEEADQMAYKADIEEADLEMAKRTKESEMKSQQKGMVEGKIASWTKSKKSAEEEFYALGKYLKDLEKPCMVGDSTYDQRKQDRLDEASALKEARTILQGAFDDMSLVQKRGFLQAPHA